MSYKTNPIFNRLKIIKGWKNPYLPTKTWNYTRDIALWFKVYLLLKTFLNLKKIQLLSCEIRFAQQNQKLLYLVINKKKNQKKKKNKTKFLKKIRTPIQKKINADSIFFFYQNCLFLKNISFLNQNVVHKKLLSKFWLTKPQHSTWINTFEKIIKLRQNSKKKIKFLEKNQIFIPVKHLKIKFYTNKQKQILSQKLRIQKINTIWYQKLFLLSQQKNSHLLEKLIRNLKNKIFESQAQIQKINKIYAFLSGFTCKKKSKTMVFKKLILNRLRRKKTVILQKLITKEFRTWNRARFFKQKLPVFALKINHQLFSQNPTFKNEFWFKNLLNLNFLVAKLQNKSFLAKKNNLNSKEKIKKNAKKAIFFSKNFNENVFLKSSLNYFLKKKQRNYFLDRISIWFLLRLKKKGGKKHFKKLKKNIKFRAKNMFFKKYAFFWKVKKFNQKKIQYRFAKKIQQFNKAINKKKIVRNYQYRLPYRKNYFNFLQLNTNFRFKYLIQDFVKKYFMLQVEAKIVHFLNEHKNQNYFRLVFPIWKKKKNQLIKKFRQGHWKQKQIFLTSPLKLATITKKFNFDKFKNVLHTNNNSRFLKKKDLLILARKKIKNLRVKNSFKRIKNSKDFRHSFKYFIPTLMHFSKNLDPQILADIFAKVLYKAKKQTWMLNTIKDILKMLKLDKNVGYKIALAGRINSADKSRLVYITRKNVPLQVFDKNMNFAYSQAKARIGVFGIKIWVYF